MLKRVWRVIAKSLGEKASNSDREADAVACVRLGLLLINLVTCGFIIANAIRHW